MKVVLLGYMGSGKSTVGIKLAKKLSLPLIDLDHFIEEKEQMSIGELFQNKGEIYFRKQEMSYLEFLLSSSEAMILSLGGGTPCFGDNMKKINKATPHVFYLQLSITGLVERLKPEKGHRPLISHLSDEELPEFIGKHLFERNSFYRQSNQIIPCDGKTIDEIVEEINALIDN